MIKDRSKSYKLYKKIRYRSKICLIKPLTGDDYLGVVMPMRI